MSHLVVALPPIEDDGEILIPKFGSYGPHWIIISYLVSFYFANLQPINVVIVCCSVRVLWSFEFVVMCQLKWNTRHGDNRMKSSCPDVTELFVPYFQSTSWNNLARVWYFASRLIILMGGHFSGQLKYGNCN